mmetsp:Transcript_39858/g.118675  ORF Transcript_39858/g.118675 Transcript_39858/m.118675 type:complete len:390 (-) Transcript_39858:356-1525(-)
MLPLSSCLRTSRAVPRWRRLQAAVHLGQRAALRAHARGMPVVTRSARGGAAPPPPPTRYDLDSLEANLSALLPGPHPAVASRRAAVLVPLFECGGEVRVVLTQRSHRLSTHQGEVCLPGGKRDEADADDVATALREAHEELALAPADARVLATLQPVLSKHFLSVTPVVAAVPPCFKPTPNPDEVEAVFDMPLSTFLEPPPRSHYSRDLKWEGHPYRIHFFEHGGFTVWGLTASILIQVAKLGFARQPAYQEHTRRGDKYDRFFHDGQRLSVGTLAAPQPGAVAIDVDDVDEGGKGTHAKPTVRARQHGDAKAAGDAAAGIAAANDNDAGCKGADSTPAARARGGRDAEAMGIAAAGPSTGPELGTSAGGSSSALEQADAATGSGAARL